jgi:hypothetical protein
MFGRWITGLIVVALAVGVWVLWPRDDTNSTTTTTSVQADPTTSAESTTTTTATTTTGPVGSSDVIETVEEAEAVLQELWFGWFEGIYNQDEDRIKEVVASQSQLDAAIAAFGVMEFAEPPTLAGLKFAETEILFNDERCTAIWATLDVTFRSGSTSGVHLMRRYEGSWRLVNLWQLKDDLWQQDCEAQLESLS